MSWVDRLLHRRRIYDDLAEEMRTHLDEKTEELIARGLSPREARYAARRAFGNVTGLEEQSRDAWQWPTVESFLLDVRFAMRQLRRTLGLSTILIVSLAIGIAATTTVFSWTRSVLLNELPGAAEPSRVMALETTSASGSPLGTSWLDYRDFRKYLRSFDGLAATFPMRLGVGDEAHTERRRAELVSANFFDVVGVHPAIGRFFPANMDEVEGAQPTAVISYDLWQSRWRGDSAVIGSVVRINRFPFTIIGIAPPAFHGSLPGERVELWVPAAMLRQIVPTGGWWLRDRGTRTFRVLARLSPHVTPAAAAAEVRSFGDLMMKANADVSKGMGAQLLPIWQSHWGIQDSLRAPLLLLLAACALVMLIVCANAANLLLARAMERRRELALRITLGASRLRLLRQLLTEVSIVATSGAALGLLATMWLARSLRWLVPSFASPNLIPPHVDGGVLVLTLLLVVAVTLLAGIAPAVYGSRESYADELRGGGRGAIGGTRATRARAVLVTAEMGLAIVALVGAGLFYESFRNSRAVSPGFDPRNVAMSSVSVTLAGYDSAHAETFLNEVADRIREQPGVSAVSYADYVPLSLGSGSWEDLQVEGYAADPGENMKLYRAAVGPDYFKTLGIPLVAGRDFTLGDDSAHARVMIVNETFVKRYLSGRAVLGVRVHGWGNWFTIVGVARDTKTFRLTDAPAPYFYVPVRQVYRPEMGYTFLARSSGRVDQTVRAIEQEVRGVDPTVPVYNGMRLAAYVEAPMQSQQAATQLLGLLATISCLLAALGLYGVISYAMSQRTKEIGVRIALGAQTSDVLKVVARQAGSLLIGGLIVGFAIAAAVARGVASMLYGVGAGNITVFMAAGGAMLLIAVVAISVPARRAMTVDPLTALRAE